MGSPSHESIDDHFEGSSPQDLPDDTFAQAEVVPGREYSYGFEIEEAIGRIILEYPNGRTIKPRNVPRAILGVDRLPDDEYLLLKQNLLMHPRVRRTRSGFFVSARTINVDPVTEKMITNWKKGAPNNNHRRAK